MSNTLLHTPLEVELDWKIAGLDAYAYTTAESFLRTVSVGEVIFDSEASEYNAYWFGPHNHVGLHLGSYASQGDARQQVDAAEGAAR